MVFYKTGGWKSMSTLILTIHSQQNADLARLTAMNKWSYASRHGYDLLTAVLDYDKQVAALLYLQKLLPHWDTILTMGSDVVIMDQKRPLESLYDVTDSVVLCHEDMPPNQTTAGDVIPPQLNNDVMLWRNHTGLAESLIHELVAHSDEWENKHLSWQGWLSAKWRDGKLFPGVRVAEPRRFNSTAIESPSHWQPGDFIIHFVRYDNAGKVELAKQWLPRVDYT